MRSWHGNLSPFGQWHTGGRASFSPAALFAFGEQGAWFDPSDVANLNWRVNLLDWTEDFTVSPWAAAALGTSTRANTTSPYSFGLGLITVTSANGGIRQSRSGLTRGQPYTLSFYLESATPNINVVFENGTAGFGALHVASIDPSTGVFSGVSGFTSTTSVPFGTGRIYTLVSAPAGGTLIANIEWRVTAASGSFLLGRPQFEAGSVATTYQPITTVDAGTVERFPTATLYQDTFGTQPVTTPGQPVGLMLDRSRGLALGPENAPNNGLFNVATGWTLESAAVTITGGRLRFTNAPSGVGNRAYFIFGRTAGTTHRFSITVESLTASVVIDFGAVVYTVSAPGTYSWVGQVTAAITNSISMASLGSAVISAISSRELAGNHATQTTPANRPIYAIEPAGGRRNLLLATDAPEAGSGLTVTARAAVAPDGTNNAARVAKTDSTTPRYTFQNWTSSTPLPNTVYTVSRYVKYDGFNTTVSVEYNTTTTFDLGWVATFSVTASGVTANTPSLCTSAVQDVGNGWYRIRATFTSGASPAASTTPMLSQITGASGASVLMYGAQIELGSVATPYQRVTTQYDVTEANVPTMSYLFFNGTNFSMSTPSIDFSVGPTNPVLGPELVVNGDFSGGSTGWAAQAGWTIGSGVASVDSSVAGGTYLRTSGFAAVAGAYYRVTFTVTSRTSGSISAAAGTAVSPLIATAVGTYSFLVQASGAGGVGVFAAGTTTIATIDNISVRQVDAAYTPDKMSVFVGVRKLSDAGNGTLLETSGGADSNNGAFFFRAPSGGLANYQFASRGTSAVSLAAFGFTSPITNVVTSTSDISADNITIRANGTQAATSSGDQGTGSYLAYPLYLGARGGSSLYFNGNLYSLIVRGAQSTATQITETEAWVAGETGFFVPVISGVPTVGIS